MVVWIILNIQTVQWGKSDHMFWLHFLLVLSFSGSCAMVFFWSMNYSEHWTVQWGKSDHMFWLHFLLVSLFLWFMCHVFFGPWIILNIETFSEVNQTTCFGYISSWFSLSLIHVPWFFWSMVVCELFWPQYKNMTASESFPNQHPAVFAGNQSCTRFTLYYCFQLQITLYLRNEKSVFRKIYLEIKCPVFVHSPWIGTQTQGRGF
jgi:hypothetical protein